MIATSPVSALAISVPSLTDASLRSNFASFN
jgi:hypothetical protein